MGVLRTPLQANARFLIMDKIKDDFKGGYDLIRIFLKQINHLFSSGTVYSTLYALERDGLAFHKQVGRRKVYKLTEDGIRELHRNLTELRLVNTLLNGEENDVES